MLPLLVDALRNVRNAQFFRTELEYQGELLAELRARIPNAGLPGDAIIEQEYQKRLRDHGIDVRPDLIIHVPTPADGDVRQGNCVVFELNHQAGPKEVAEDCANLDTVVRALNYPLAVFVNIDTRQTQAGHYRGFFRERLRCFAVRNADKGVEIRHAQGQCDPRRAAVKISDIKPTGMH